MKDTGGSLYLVAYQSGTGQGETARSGAVSASTVACSPIKLDKPASTGRALLVGFGPSDVGELTALLEHSGYSSVMHEPHVHTARTLVHDSTAQDTPYHIVIINATTDLTDLVMLGCRLRSDRVPAYLLGEIKDHHVEEDARSTHIPLVPDYFSLCTKLFELRASGATERDACSSAIALDNPNYSAHPLLSLLPLLEEKQIA